MKKDNTLFLTHILDSIAAIEDGNRLDNLI